MKTDPKNHRFLLRKVSPETLKIIDFPLVLQCFFDFQGFQHKYRFWVDLGGSWKPLGHLLGPLGASLGRLAGILDASWGRLGVSWGRLEGVLGRLGGVLDVQGVVLETSRGVCWPE